MNDTTTPTRGPFYISEISEWNNPSKSQAIYFLPPDAKEREMVKTLGHFVNETSARDVCDWLNKAYHAGKAREVARWSAAREDACKYMQDVGALIDAHAHWGQGMAGYAASMVSDVIKSMNGGAL